MPYLSKIVDGIDLEENSVLYVAKGRSKSSLYDHVYMYIEGVTEDGLYYFYQFDFLPTKGLFSPLLDPLGIPAPDVVPLCTVAGVVNVKGHHVPLTTYFEIPQETVHAQRLSIESEDYLYRLIQEKTLKANSFLYCAIDSETEARLLADIREDFRKNNTPDAIKYKYSGMDFVQISSHNTELKMQCLTIINDYFQRLRAELTEQGQTQDDHEYRKIDGKLSIVRQEMERIEEEGISTAFWSRLFPVGNEEEEADNDSERAQLTEEINEKLRILEDVRAQYALDGSGHNCLTWIKEKIKKQGIELEPETAWTEGTAGDDGVALPPNLLERANEGVAHCFPNHPRSMLTRAPDVTKNIRAGITRYSLFLQDQQVHASPKVVERVRRVEALQSQGGGQLESNKWCVML